MCSIFGALGDPDPNHLIALREAAGDRGRDGGRMEEYLLPQGRRAVLGNWRATPTTELERGMLQPYDRLVHNGTIANDKALGGRDDEIDSQVLARVLDRTNVRTLAASLQRVKGSYALGLWNGETVLLATNYKPIYYWSPDGETVYFSSMARHFEALLPFGQAPVAVPPYSALDLLTRERVDLPREYAPKALVIASAGLDSTVVATYLVRQGYQVRLIHYTYGCIAESQEMTRIPRIADALGCEYDIVPMDYSRIKGRSPLFDKANYVAGGIAGAEFAHEWVPARNLLMLAHTTAYAEAHGFHVIALGNNLEEAGAYPDNEEEFTTRFGQVLPFAVRDGYRVDIVSPVGHLMKHEIVTLGLRLDTPFEHTWSCYRDGERHCGACGPCYMRREAFARNGVHDPVFR
jgi:7-cyano-7-deazaguanine synthase